MRACWDIPPSTLGAVARHVATSLKSRSVRVIGDPALPVKRVGRGAHVIAGNMAALPLVDMLIVSEAREWDSLEYIRDTVLSGQKKGAVIVSHEAGEEAGMDNCANWVRGFVSEVPVKFIETDDQIWIPGLERQSDAIHCPWRGAWRPQRSCLAPPGRAVVGAAAAAPDAAAPADLVPIEKLVQSPSVSISNGVLSAKIYLPDATKAASIAARASTGPA